MWCMSLSPSFADRLRVPEQPRPPLHWPEECREVIAPTAATRIWKCPTCTRTHERRVEDLAAGVIGLMCHGDGAVEEMEA